MGTIETTSSDSAAESRQLEQDLRDLHSALCSAQPDAILDSARRLEGWVARLTRQDTSTGEWSEKLPMLRKHLAIAEIIARTALRTNEACVDVLLHRNQTQGVYNKRGTVTRDAGGQKLTRI